MNCYGKGRSQEYVVQFWDAGNLIAFEIMGGVADDDKKSKVTTVVFEDEDCVHFETGQSPFAGLTRFTPSSPGGGRLQCARRG